MKIVSIRLELGSKIRKDNRQTVYIRLTKQKRMRRLNTGLYARSFSKDFDKDSQHGNWFKKSDPQYKGKNQILKDLIYKLESAHFYFEANRIAPTLNAIMKYMQEEEKETDFFKFSERVLERIKDSGSIGTYLKNKSSVKKFHEFVKTKNLDFRDIDVELLNNYESHMQRNGNSVNTIHKDLKTIRTIFNNAIREDVVEQSFYPFFKKKLRTEKTTKKKLSEDELQRFIDLDLEIDTTLGKTKQYFLFSFYCCGMRFGDVCKLKRKDIVDDRLTYKMGKTNEVTSFKLIPQAITILENFNYNDKEPNDYIFPLIDKNYTDKFLLHRRISSMNALTNKTLKQLAKLAKIEGGINFHESRHSFSNLALTRGVNVVDISRLLNHSSIKITQIYLSSIDEQAVDNAMDMVFK